MIFLIYLLILSCIFYYRFLGLEGSYLKPAQDEYALGHLAMPSKNKMTPHIMVLNRKTGCVL